MPIARNQQISLNDTPYYHCISRCVRRAYLCGQDNVTGNNYEHRKQWVVQRLAKLANVFAIDVYGYAVMDNHCHTILKINAIIARNWTEQEVIKRWKCLFNLPELIQHYLLNRCNTAVKQEKAKEIIAIWRERLMDISWFMRCLNEHIARKANKEDNCSGRFWEGRFKSQALLNEQALLTCLVYVDLNPIRSDISKSLETSKYTSVKQRIEQLTDKGSHSPIPLARFGPDKNANQGIHFSLKDYLELTEWTGRSIRTNKRGFIKDKKPKILQTLNIDEKSWVDAVSGFSTQFYTFIGSDEQLQNICQKLEQKWLRGIKVCRQLFNSPTPYPV